MSNLQLYDRLLVLTLQSNQLIQYRHSRLAYNTIIPPHVHILTIPLPLLIIMRLLHFTQAGDLRFTKDFIDNIPPYAILSHTWGDDDDEVAFKDVAEGTHKNKIGYDKIRFCGKQAASDSLNYFWVDTCCINRADYTELHTAINSMFRWYENATKCYVYLTDVSTSTGTGLLTWEDSFRKSRWFTRGWTLQELLAPLFVEFFSKECHRLGDKKSLQQQISDITAIPITVLQGALLSSYNIEERMYWSNNRQTKREEDRAYSLLGIFGVNMPLIYGEGMKSAFTRLREEIDKRLVPKRDPSSPSSERCK